MHTKLTTRGVEKPWGVASLPVPFEERFAGRIGEVWFEPSAALDELLVKYIFTSEALSVQVHPSDQQTMAAGLGRQGKEECWLVIDAEPGAVLGVGFARDLGTDELRAAALDGSIEGLLTWHPVEAGDFFYIPAGTVHAIGAGVSLIEVQQNSDITYRLYDYGRPRELHLDAGMAVARGEPYPAALHRRVGSSETTTLVDGPLFRLDQLRGPPDQAVLARYAGAPVLIIPRQGTVTGGGSELTPGDCAVVSSLHETAVGADCVYLAAQPCR